MHYPRASGDAEEKETRKIKLGEFQISVKCSLKNLSHVLRPESHFFPPLRHSFGNKGPTRLKTQKGKAEKNTAMKSPGLTKPTILSSSSLFSTRKGDSFLKAKGYLHRPPGGLTLCTVGPGLVTIPYVVQLFLGVVYGFFMPNIHREN